MRITKPKRGRRASKRLDLTDMRELFRDRRVWGAIGVVVKPNAAEHYQAVTAPADVIVEVTLQPSLTPVSCRVGAGLWIIPEEGEEVAVLLPEGAVDFMPTIVAILSSDNVPTAQGPTPGRIVLHRGQVYVHDGAGGAVSLALKQDVINVDNKYAAHIHLSPSGSTGGPLSTTLVNPPNPNYPGLDPVNPFLTNPGGVPTTNPNSPGNGLTAATITGTSCLFAK